MNTIPDPYVAGGVVPPACPPKNERAPRPEFVRFPRNGERDPVAGLSRMTLYRLRAAGLITVKNLRRPGQVRGCSLISVASLLSYINGTSEKVAA